MPGFRSTVPIQTSRTVRRDVGRGITSGKAGKVIPVRYIPVLREERLANANVQVQVQLAETVKPLMNAVYCQAEAWFVPFAAFNRFEGIDDFNRSYAKVDGNSGPPPDFIRSGAFALNEIYTAMGIHAPVGSQVNLAIIEAYNEIINISRKDTSPNLPLRTELQATLATAMWQRNRFGHVVPNYDRSFIDGLVPVSNPTGFVPVKGLGINSGAGTTVNHNTATTTSSEVIGDAVLHGWKDSETNAGTAGRAQFVMSADPARPGFPNVRITLDEAQFNISLANIDLARQSAAFEALRKRYAGHEDEEIINLLMEGIRVPEYMERQPMLLSSRVTQFGYQTRYATDGANLDTSVTEGVAAMQMSLNMPKTNVGGIVMVMVSVVPDQMFERQADPFLNIIDQDIWPKYERDTLDVEKVDLVLNGSVDTAHGSPGGTFGYEPMNAKWNRDLVRLGGKYYKTAPGGAWSEDRAAVWVTEPVNPALSTEWYLATSMNNDPFADRVADHLDISVVHEAAIEGSVVFGPKLLEVIPGNE